MSYWRADPHQWGPGQTHIIHPDGDKTLCGVKLANCPGRLVPEVEHNCRGCAKVIEAQENRAAREAAWKVRQQQYQEEQEEKRRLWRLDYAAYLESPDWLARRAAVLKRADGRCEACGKKRSRLQVHHTTYRHVFHEPLFELKAVCEECHEQITAMDRGEFYEH